MCIVVGLKLRKGRAVEEDRGERMWVLVGPQMMASRGALGSRVLKDIRKVNYIYVRVMFRSSWQMEW